MCVYIARLVWPLLLLWPWTLNRRPWARYFEDVFVYQKVNFLNFLSRGFQHVEHQQNRDTHTHTHTDVAGCITTPHIGGGKISSFVVTWCLMWRMTETQWRNVCFETDFMEVCSVGLHKHDRHDFVIINVTMWKTVWPSRCLLAWLTARCRRVDVCQGMSSREIASPLERARGVRVGKGKDYNLQSHACCKCNGQAIIVLRNMDIPGVCYFIWSAIILRLR